MKRSNAKQLKKTGKKIKKTISNAIDRKSSGPSKTAVAAGVATAGIIGVGVATAVKRGRGAPGTTTFLVAPHEKEGWALLKMGDSKPLQVFERKRSAVSAAREVARSSEPSTLVIHDSGGKVQRTHEYASA